MDKVKANKIARVIRYEFTCPKCTAGWYDTVSANVETVKVVCDGYERGCGAEFEVDLTK